MLLCLLTALVATCGQKGPLYLPDSPEVRLPATASLHIGN
ncbi:MAG: lipoprotein [Pseudomonadota bacterium]